MATFLYVHPETTELIEWPFPCGKAPDRIELEDGTVCERSLEAEIASQGGASPKCWPMKSRALAVHPSQRKEFDKMGHPIFMSRGHRKQYAELVGATDFDGGYGDPNSG
jgi:hypothetical protein